MTRIIDAIAVAADILFAPFVYSSAFLTECIRKLGVKRMRLCKKALIGVGLFSLTEHYYDPAFGFKGVTPRVDRLLPGIAWNEKE